jgi:nucleoside-diphosphate-sugar epimerase
MRVFIAGGTGAIGIRAVPALISAGHQVSALARSAEKAKLLEDFGAEPVAVSLFDRPALATAFADHDAVVNLASALPPTTSFIRKSAWRECETVRVKGSATVTDACLDAGVPRLIQESVVMLYRDGGHTWIDEEHPVDHYPITKGNHAAEGSARRFAHAGGRVAVLRFGLFYGSGAAHSQQIVALARRHIGLVSGPQSSYMSSIHVADAAGAVVAALADSASGTFNIVDNQPVTKAEHAQACADAVGAATWLKGPGRLGLLLGDRLTSLTRSLRVTNARFRGATSWQPHYPSVHEGLRAMARHEDN